MIAFQAPHTGFDYIRDHLGYRLEVQTATFPDALTLQLGQRVESGGAMQFEFEVHNLGIGIGIGIPLFRYSTRIFCFMGRFTSQVRYPIQTSYIIANGVQPRQDGTDLFGCLAV